MKPVLVAEVSFTEWTDDGTLRHPSFIGLRADKAAREVVREPSMAPAPSGPAVNPPQRNAVRSVTRPVTDKNAVAGIALTNPDKTLYPEAAVSKRDLALYYAAVGESMLPHLSRSTADLASLPQRLERGMLLSKEGGGRYQRGDLAHRNRE